MLALLSSQHSSSQVPKTTENKNDENYVDVKQQAKGPTEAGKSTKSTRLEDDNVKMDMIKQKDSINQDKDPNTDRTRHRVEAVDGISSIDTLTTAPSPAKTRPLSKGDALHSYIKSKQNKTEPVFATAPPIDISMDDFKTPKKLPSQSGSSKSNSTNIVEGSVKTTKSSVSGSTGMKNKTFAPSSSISISSRNKKNDGANATNQKSGTDTVSTNRDNRAGRVSTNQNSGTKTISTNRNSRAGRVSAHQNSRTVSADRNSASLSQNMNGQQHNEASSTSTNHVSSLSIKPLVNTMSQKSDIPPSSSRETSKILNDEEFNAVIAGDSEDSSDDDGI